MANSELGELRFVDHVEFKIESPEKEVISPTKSPISPFSLSLSNGNSAVDSETSLNKGSKTALNESKDSDSGLDSSNDSSEVVPAVNSDKEMFIDRQESQTPLAEPSVIVSPTREVDKLFNFLGTENQSLDEANNNNDAVVERIKVEDIYQGKEVDLHVTSDTVNNNNANDQQGDLEQVKEGQNQVSQAYTNLYWYSSNAMAVDLEELEALKSSEPEAYTSTMDITVGNGYYAAKSHQEIDYAKSIPDAKPNSTESKLSEQGKEAKKTSIWSSAFESASSRFLDVAKEKKTEPKTVKNLENTATRNEQSHERHPWGLEREEKLERQVNNEVEEAADKLPEIAAFDHTEEKVKTYIDQTDGIVRDNKTEKYEDQADAIGFMERKDNPFKDLKSIEQSITAETGEQLKCASNVTQKEYLDKDEDDKEKTENHSEDEADAVGLMELKDKPVEQDSKASENAIQESSSRGIATTIVNPERSKSADIKPVEYKQMKKVFGNLDDEEVEDGTDTIDGKKVESSNITTVKQVPLKPIYDPYIVRRTFKVPDNCEQLIQSQGGLLTENISLIDEYLDDNDYSLLLKDCWLRLRNKKFEMKLNSAFGTTVGTNGKTQFLTNENEIKEKLLKMFDKKLKQKRRVSERHLDVLIDSLGLIEFTTFETTRKQYKLGECQVAIELTNFGFQVGEIEMEASNPVAIPDVLHTIETLATKLGPMVSFPCLFDNQDERLFGPH